MHQEPNQSVRHPMLSLFIVLLFALLFFTHAEGAKPMPPKELAEFLGPVSPKKIEWTKTVGI